MKINDAITGLLFLAVAIFVFIHAGSFKTMPGVPYGPGLFPKIIACVMGLGSLLLIISGLRKTNRDTWVQLEEWAYDPRSYMLFSAVIGCFLFYIFFAEQLGFLLVSFILLTGFMALTRGFRLIVSSAVISSSFSAIIFFLGGQASHTVDFSLAPRGVFGRGVNNLFTDIRVVCDGQPVTDWARSNYIFRIDV